MDYKNHKSHFMGAVFVTKNEKGEQRNVFTLSRDAEGYSSDSMMGKKSNMMRSDFENHLIKELRLTRNRVGEVIDAIDLLIPLKSSDSGKLEKIFEYISGMFEFLIPDRPTLQPQQKQKLKPVAKSQLVVAPCNQPPTPAPEARSTVLPALKPKRALKTLPKPLVTKPAAYTAAFEPPASDHEESRKPQPEDQVVTNEDSDSPGFG